MDKITLNQSTFIYYNGVTKHYAGGNYNNAINNIKLWGDFGMSLNKSGPLIKIITKNCPKGTAIIAYQGDYTSPISEELSKNFEKCLLVVRYKGIPHSIVIPGDDLFFEDPDFYMPKLCLPFDERENKVFWRGSCTWQGRIPIVFALRNVPGCDVKFIRRILYHEFITHHSVIDNDFSEEVSPEEPSKYTIWLSIEGWGCASDTTRALMSGCAVIYFRVTTPWFDEFLVHEENCIIIQNDLSKLLYYINKMLNDTDFTRKIAENGKTLSEKIFKPEFYKQFILDQLTQS
jgi:hypothetical protein